MVVKKAGYIFSQVVLVKKKQKATYVYVDAGLQTGIYTYKDIVHVCKEEVVDEARIIYAFYDISCNHKRICVNALKHQVQAGDTIVFSNCGSYVSCFINTFHLFDRPQMIDIKDLYYV